MWKNQTVKSHIFSYFKAKRAAKTTRYNLQGQSWLLLSQINIKNEWRFCSARKLTCALHDILHQGKNNYKWHYCCTLACLYQVESSSLCSHHKDLGWSPNPFCPTDQLFRGEHSLQDQIHHQHLKMKDANLTEVLLQKKLKLEHYKRRMIRIDKVVHISKKQKKGTLLSSSGRWPLCAKVIFCSRQRNIVKVYMKVKRISAIWRAFGILPWY